MAALLLGLGIYVIWRFLAIGGRRPQFKGKLSALFLGPPGVVAGLMDAIGGGGWGPVGTTALMSSGRLEPRKVVGSIDTAEFVVAIGGSGVTALTVAAVVLVSWISLIVWAVRQEREARAFEKEFEAATA